MKISRFWRLEGRPKVPNSSNDQKEYLSEEDRLRKELISALAQERLRALSKRSAQQQTDAGQESIRAALVVQSRSAVLPLSHAQERLWMLEQLGLPGGTYTIRAAVRLEGVLEVASLEATLSAIVGRHESLRTRFGSVDGVPYQVIDPAVPVVLDLMDLSELEGGEQEGEVARLAQESVARRFDLEAGPLLRVELLRLGSAEHVVLLSMHHIVSDGWSMGVLIEEIGRLYAGYASGIPVELKPLTVQYPDYALWQRNWLKDEVLEVQKAYWRKQMEGASQVLELPTDHVRPMVQSYRGAHHPVALSKELSTTLEQLARAEGATLFMVLLSAFQVLLSRWSGQEDVVGGSPMSRRTQAETEGLIGFFVNTLALRAEISGEHSFRTLLGQVRERTLSAYEHQDLPFEQVVEMLEPERDMSRQPVFQVMFVLQNAPRGVLELPGLKLSVMGGEQATAKFDLELSVSATEEGLRGSLEYATDLFEAATMKRFVEQYERVLSAVAANPEQKVGEIEILSAEERTQLLYGWNQTSHAVAESTLPELFEAQVIKTPEATAVVYEDQSLTYAELNLRANQLAHLLIHQGVGPETIVGICVERSLEMVISLLG